MNATESISPQVFHVLLSLALGEKHGYAIMANINIQTGGQIILGPGTLYGSLKRMADSNWIEECDPKTLTKGEDSRRKYYRLTSSGKNILNTELSRLEQTVKLARGLLGVGGAKWVVSPSHTETLVLELGFDDRRERRIIITSRIGHNRMCWRFTPLYVGIMQKRFILKVWVSAGAFHHFWSQ